MRLGVQFSFFVGFSWRREGALGEGGEERNLRADARPAGEAGTRSLKARGERRKEEGERETP